MRGRPRSNVAQLREIAIGEVQSRNGTAEALIIRLVEVKARLDRDAAERSTDCVPFDPKRSCRQRCRAERSRTADLDGADDRTVAENPAGATGAVETSEGKPFAEHKALCRVGIEAFGERWCCSEQGSDQGRVRAIILIFPRLQRAMVISNQAVQDGGGVKVRRYVHRRRSGAPPRS